jgi:hypothetical protein
LKVLIVGCVKTNRKSFSDKLLATFEPSAVGGADLEFGLSAASLEGRWPEAG